MQQVSFRYEVICANVQFKMRPRVSVINFFFCLCVACGYKKIYTERRFFSSSSFLIFSKIKKERSSMFDGVFKSYVMPKIFFLTAGTSYLDFVTPIKIFILFFFNEFLMISFIMFRQNNFR